MNKKFLILPIIVIIIIIFVTTLQPNQSDKKNEPNFHVTLATPNQYENGVYTNTFLIEEGEYFFRFVPNGDSPQNLSITLQGDDYHFSETFLLKGQLHETGISEYYTWDYDGEKSIIIPSQKNITIVINPNGNVKGSVSVSILEV